MGHSPPHTPPTLPINLTHTSRVHPVVILIENINQIPQPHTLQACKFIILIPVKKATEQVMWHHINLGEPHGPLINLPQHKGGRPMREIAHPSKHKHLPTSHQEGEHNLMTRPKGVNVTPDPFMQVKGGNKARVYPKDIEFPSEESTGEGRGGVS